MAVTIVTGNIGCGKTLYCINEIQKKHEQSPLHKCVMLVPSHYSHETEKMFIDRFGGTGLNNIEVTSFEKLARELLSGTEKRLGASGKQALICRAVENTLSELNIRRSEFDSRIIAAVGKPGFLDVALSLISELHRYVISVNDIAEKAAEIDNGTLKQKLEITAMLADNYDKLIKNTDYIDADEDLLRLASVVGNKFKNTSVWIDKFDEFLPQQLEVLFALIKSGTDITITFNTCDDISDTYYGTLSAIEKINGFCEAKAVHLEGAMEHLKNTPDLRFLFSSWFDRSVYQGNAINAEIFEARDSYTEIEHIASRILDLVREDGYRFCDISVLCPDNDSYNHIIEAIFDEYDIAYYSDETLSIAEHPIAMQVLSLFDIIENNWNYSSMFEYLRAGFIYLRDTKNKFRRIPSNDIDILENYVLKYGVRGKSMWCRSWIEGQKDIISEALGTAETNTTDIHKNAEHLRHSIVSPINNFSEAAKKARTVSDYCCALYEFLEDINLYQGLKAELLAMAMNRATADAQRFGQIWNLILDILDQVNTALGPYEVTSDEFFSYIRAAMTKCEIRTIPSGVDRVFIGAVEKNKTVASKIIFMAGAVSGTFPTESAIEGFLSNADREYLKSKNINLAPTTTRKNAKQYNNVYKALSAVSDRLCISYPVQTSEGKACRPSQTVIDICAKLPNIKKYNDIIIAPEDAQKMYISSPKATLHKMFINHAEHPLWTHVNSWFNEHEQWQARLFTVNKAKRNCLYKKIALDPSLANLLYNGEITYSSTRLNSYAECPFRFFLQYGLRARNREQWELNAADIGTYTHEIIRRLCEKIDNDSTLDWKTISDEQCGTIIDELIDDTISRITLTDINGKERTADIFARMGKTIKAASVTIRKSISSGSFRTLAYEKEIDVSITPQIRVKGVIDRLDVCEHDGINEYRIIDYKTGKKEFKAAEIYNGCDMQPVIYAMAMRILDRSAMISGMYYSRVRNDFASIQSTGRISTAKTQLDKNVRLNGATFVDTDSDGNIIPESAERIETELARADGSLFFDKSMKTGKNVRSRKAGERLTELVRDRIISTDKEIRNGCVNISPLDKDANHSACSFCEFSAVCKFDEEHTNHRTITEKDSDVWNFLEEDK